LSKFIKRKKQNLSSRIRFLLTILELM